MDKSLLDKSSLDKSSLDTSSLDTSWIEIFEDEEKYYTMFYPEKATEIKANMLYVNKENELEKIGEKMIYLNTEDKINRNDLVKIIQENNKLDKIRYKLTGIRIYNIDLKHTDLKHFLNNPELYDFTRDMRNLEDYTLEPTINCLQNLNRIYIIFSEEKDHEKKTLTNSNNTKRVKFNLDHKKTRRRK